MATGIITKTQIANDSQTFIGKMLEVRENKPVVPQTVDTKTLPNGFGLTYNEPYVGALTAVTLTDGVEFDSPSTFSDTNIQVTAVEYGVQTLISKLTNDQTKEDLFAINGKLHGNAMAYKMDQTGIAQIQAFGGVLGSGTATLVAGHITAAAATIRAGLAQSGATARTGARSSGDPSDSKMFAVIHEYQRRALAAQLSGTFSAASDAGIGTTSPVMDRGTNRVGLSPYQVQWLEQHYMGRLDQVEILTDNNIVVTASAARGAVYAQDSVIHLRYRTPNHYEVDTVDGRARRVTTSDTWGFGERADVWGVVLSCAAVTPTT